MISLRALLFFAFWPSVALADDALRLELIDKALQGQGMPALVVHADTTLTLVTIELVRSVDGKKMALGAKSVRAGASQRFDLELTSPGKSRFTGTLAAKANGESLSMPLDVEVELIAPIVVTVAPDDVDLAARRLAVTANRALARVEVELTSDQGASLGVFDGLADGARATLQWPEVKGTILRMHVKAYDAAGFFGAVDLFPWRVDIPHEDILFASGSHDVPPAEAKKLDVSYVEIQGAVKRFGKLATIQLFIAGHTDTVGDAASNAGLSERRAQAIGRWFKRRGVSIPISFAGFGEELPLVKTADEVDEARNRRAEYIVAVEAPTIRGRRPWTPLR